MCWYQENPQRGPPSRNARAQTGRIPSPGPRNEKARRAFAEGLKDVRKHKAAQSNASIKSYSRPARASAGEGKTGSSARERKSAIQTGYGPNLQKQSLRSGARRIASP